MNKSFPDKQTYNLGGGKIQKKKFKFLQKKFCCLLSLVLSLFGHNFCSRAPIEKSIIFPQSLSVFLSSKKVSKNHNKNSARRYLPKIPFVLWTDNGPLGINVYTEKKQMSTSLPKILAMNFFLAKWCNIKQLVCLTTLISE